MSLIDKNGLKINSVLVDFINNEAIPGTGVEPDDFWSRFENVVHELTPINKALIKKRETIQKKIDDWHKNNAGKDFNKKEYINFLRSISYIFEEKEDFARFKIYFTHKKSEADFIVYFTEFESFAGCSR